MATDAVGQKLARPRATIDSIIAGLALLGSRTDISANLSREAFRERLSELSSKVHEPFGRAKATDIAATKRGRVFGAALVPRVAIAVARAILLRLPPMWFVS
jgi:hypothetical protein